MRWLFLVILGIGGCAGMYPKVLDSPQFRDAVVEMVREGSKSWEAEGRVHNPEVEAYYKMSVGVRIIGVDGKLGARGVTTRPGA